MHFNYGQSTKTYMKLCVEARILSLQDSNNILLHLFRQYSNFHDLFIYSSFSDLQRKSNLSNEPTPSSGTRVIRFEKLIKLYNLVFGK